MRLNLGCCELAVAGFIGVDIAPGPMVDQVADLRFDWPWADNSVDEIRAHDVFEHLPDKIHTLNEAYRVLKPGGKLDMIVPTTDGRGAWQDPTHCSYWNPNSLFYLEHGNPHSTRFAKAYGMRHQFRIVRSAHTKHADEVWKLHAVLQAVK